MWWVTLARAVEFPSDAEFINVTDYGAVGDGVQDDTAAIQAALAAAGWRKLVYFPDGTYLVSNTLRTRTDTYGLVLLQGQSEAGTVLKLADDTFRNPGNPRAVLDFGTWFSADAFSNAVRDLTIDTGVDNPGAIGLRFFSNNTGDVSRVTVRSGDGAGVIVLDLGYNDMNGPLLVEKLSVEGFDLGISCACAVNSQTLEHVSLSGQNVVGLRNGGQALSIRDLISNNSVPAVQNTSASGNLVVVGGTLTGGASGEVAFENVGNPTASRCACRRLRTGGRCGDAPSRP